MGPEEAYITGFADGERAAKGGNGGTIYQVIVDTSALPETNIDTIETYEFTDRNEAEKFRDHLRDLYGLDVNLGIKDIYTYDEAIAALVEAYGPSRED